MDPVAGSAQPIILSDDGTAEIMGKNTKKKKVNKKQLDNIAARKTQEKLFKNAAQKKEYHKLL